VEEESRGREVDFHENKAEEMDIRKTHITHTITALFKSKGMHKKVMCLNYPHIFINRVEKPII
jgi:hypothetical protein